MSKLVYLAGPISGLSYGQCTDWRAYARQNLILHGIEGLDPMRGKDYLAHEEKIADSYAGTVLSSQKGITTRDRWDCQRADVVLVNLLGADRVSIGTVMEIAWADAVRTPIVLVTEPKGNIHDHAMIREAAGFIVPTLDDAISIVVAILGEHA
jgi:nucleoside 2-deoxyribosyltransferase